jgi:hypothetical protein
MSGSPRYQLTIKQLVHKAFSPSITFLPTEANRSTNSHIKLIFPWFRQSNRSDWYEVAIASLNVITKGLPVEPLVIESETIETPYQEEDSNEIEVDTLEDMGDDLEDDEEEINTEWIEGERLCHQYYEDQHEFTEGETFSFVGQVSEIEYNDVPLNAKAKRRWIYDNKMVDIQNICEIERAIYDEHGTTNCFKQIQTIARVCTALDPANKQNELDAAGIAMHQLMKQILEPGNFKFKFDGCKYALAVMDNRARHGLISDVLYQWLEQTFYSDDVYFTFQVTIEDTIEQLISYRPHTQSWYIKSNPKDVGHPISQALRGELEVLSDNDVTRPQLWFKFKESLAPYWEELEAIRDARLKKENYKGFGKAA